MRIAPSSFILRSLVIPAQAGIPLASRMNLKSGVPAFAGVTVGVGVSKGK